jgi:glutathione S-transferase
VKWLLHELIGADFEVEIVDLYAADQYSTSYLEMNPNHNVPTLELQLSGGRSMYMIESGAMVVLLADCFPQNGLAPAALPMSYERADYLQIVHFGACWMDMMLWQIRIHEHLLRSTERDARTINRYRAKFVSEVEPQLKNRLIMSRFICGDTFSAADCIIGQNVLWAKAYELCAGTPFDDYVSRLSERSAFQQAFADADQLTPEMPAGSPAFDKFTG